MNLDEDNILKFHHKDIKLQVLNSTKLKITEILNNKF